MSATDDARRAIIKAAAAVHEASMAAAWCSTGPSQSASVAEATEYAMAGLRGLQAIVREVESSGLVQG